MISIIITAVLSIIGTLYVPKLVAHTKRYFTEKKHKREQALRNVIKEEIKNVLLELKNN
jgi:hypothetical protein